MMSIRQQNRSAPRGAVRIQRLIGVLVPRRARSDARPRCSSAAPARRQHQRVRVTRRVRTQQHRLVVDRDDPLAAADLLLHDVLEQVAAHRAGGMRAEALALAGDGGGHESQREQPRGEWPGRGVLVDAEVHVGRVAVRAHALAPQLGGGAQLVDGQLGERIR